MSFINIPLEISDYIISFLIDPLCEKVKEFFLDEKNLEEFRNNIRHYYFICDKSDPLMYPKNYCKVADKYKICKYNLNDFKKYLFKFTIPTYIYNVLINPLYIKSDSDKEALIFFFNCLSTRKFEYVFQKWMYDKYPEFSKKDITVQDLFCKYCDDYRYYEGCNQCITVEKYITVNTIIKLL